MATIKISALPVASTIDGANDVLPITQSSITNKITRNVLLGITSAPLGTTDSQSPTNKTFDNTNVFTTKDGSFTLQNTAATTKQATFSLASITAGQTRVLTIPDASLTIVGTATTQTLTAKTLTAPTITGPTITGTIAGSGTYSTPTLTTPTIADFTNATHNHSNAAGGGSTLTSPTINTAIVSNPTMRQWDGWIDANESWTFSTATAVTVPSDATTKYQVGDRVKLTQSATVRYFYITGVTSTVLTLNGGSDYTVANSAISANAYSHDNTPLSFPDFFNWTVSYTGFSANPSGGTARFKVMGHQCFVDYHPAVGGTSNNTAHTMSLPIQATSLASYTCDGVGRAGDAGGGTVAALIEFSTSATTANIYKDMGGDAWTSSGTSLFFVNFFYQI